MAGSRHPSDAEREAAARPAVMAVLEGVRDGEMDVARAALREDVVLLGPGGRLDGPDAVTESLSALRSSDLAWTAPEQHGAHAVLRHSGGGLVIETRRGVVVLVIALP